MREVSTEYFMSKNLSHYITFCGLFYDDVKSLIAAGNDSYGNSINECSSDVCNCNISIIYPEILLGDIDSTTFVCPFCYAEKSSSNNWGYSLGTIFGEEYFPYGYSLSIYFRDVEDACLFYMKYGNEYSTPADLCLNHNK